MRDTTPTVQSSIYYPEKSTAKLFRLANQQKKERHTTTLNTRISSTREKPCCPTHSHTHTRANIAITVKMLFACKCLNVTLVTPLAASEPMLASATVTPATGGRALIESLRLQQAKLTGEQLQFLQKVTTISCPKHDFRYAIYVPVRAVVGWMGGGGGGFSALLNPSEELERAVDVAKENGHTNTNREKQTCAASGMSFIVLNCVAHFRHRICVYSVC